MFPKNKEPRTHPKPNSQIELKRYSFVELGGGVGDVRRWCRDGAYVEFGFR